VEEMRHAMRLEHVPMDPRLAEVLKLLRGTTFGEPKGNKKKDAIENFLFFF
jgi:hypothetical protein